MLAFALTGKERGRLSGSLESYSSVGTNKFPYVNVETLKVFLDEPGLAELKIWILLLEYGGRS